MASREWELVHRIVADICGRKGLDDSWDDIDVETRNEITTKWEGFCRDAIRIAEIHARLEGLRENASALSASEARCSELTGVNDDLRAALNISDDELEASRARCERMMVALEKLKELAGVAVARGFDPNAGVVLEACRAALADDVAEQSKEPTVSIHRSKEWWEAKARARLASQQAELETAELREWRKTIIGTVARAQKAEAELARVRAERAATMAAKKEQV